MEEAIFLKDKTLGGIFKHLRLPDEVYLKLLESGEEAMSNKKSVTKASSLEYYLYEKTDLEDVRAKRKRNYELVYEFGNFHDFDFLFPYKKDIIPKNVPLILKNRNNIRKSLMTKNIFLPVHWPIDNFNASSKIAKALSDTELSLVIDQRYSINEIEYQLESLLRVANYG